MDETTPHDKEIDTMRTPWGESQTITRYADGLYFVSTAGHGGMRVETPLLNTMPKELKAFQPFAGPGWYEEDCDVVIPILAFPHCFTPKEVQSAIDHVVKYGGDYFAPVKKWIESQPPTAPVFVRANEAHLDKPQGPRYKIVPCHGERQTIFHVVDCHVTEREQPCVIATFVNNRAEAEAYLNELVPYWERQEGWDSGGNCLTCGEAGRCRCPHPDRAQS